MTQAKAVNGMTRAARDPPRKAPISSVTITPAGLPNPRHQTKRTADREAVSVGTALTPTRCRIISYEALDTRWIRSMNGSLSLSVTSAEMIDPCRRSPDDLPSPLHDYRWMHSSRPGEAIATRLDRGVAYDFRIWHSLDAHSTSCGLPFAGIINFDPEPL